MLKYIFNPFLFPLVFSAGYVLYLLQLTHLIEWPVAKTTIYLFLSLICYITGVVLAFLSEFDLPEHKISPQILFNKSVIKYVWILYLICLLSFIFEHINFIINYGSIPILKTNFEVLRLKFPINGYIHLIAIMNYIFLYIISIDYIYYEKYRKKRFYKSSIILFVILSLFMGFIMGSRGIIAEFIIYSFIAISFKKRISFTTTSFLAFFAYYILGLAKFIRDYFYYGSNIFTSISKDWNFGDSYYMIPLYFSYLTVAQNFNMLNLYIKSIDRIYYGYFSLLLPFYSLLPGEQYSLINLQADMLHINFHGKLTATILSVPYIDFGILGCLPFIIIGFVIGYLYKNIIKYQLLKDILPYSYLYFHLLEGIYDYTFDQFHIILNIIILIIISSFIDKREMHIVFSQSGPIIEPSGES